MSTPKHPAAVAWDEWTEENPGALDATSLDGTIKSNYFLENRLHRAFRDGITAGEQIERARIAAKLTDLISHD